MGTRSNDIKAKRINKTLYSFIKLRTINKAKCIKKISNEISSIKFGTLFFPNSGHLIAGTLYTSLLL